ncbi:hypothetical protein N008_02525 [Hymenobacter sp. APR13]|nr:hypothetical protein N008_02525 [Hymenobacter sp. APR13]
MSPRSSVIQYICDFYKLVQFGLLSCHSDFKLLESIYNANNAISLVFFRSMIALLFQSLSGNSNSIPYFIGSSF